MSDNSRKFSGNAETEKTQGKLKREFIREAQLPSLQPPGNVDAGKKNTAAFSATHQIFSPLRFVVFQTPGPDPAITGSYNYFT